MKWTVVCLIDCPGIVSLFTREWIEIAKVMVAVGFVPVSLFTREWIEIMVVRMSPILSESLPLYEGVD